MRMGRGYGRRYRPYERYTGSRSIHKINLMPKSRYHRKLPIKNNELMSLIGLIIVLIGIIAVFKNTIIYSGVGSSKGLKIGVPCSLAFISMIIGIVVMLCSKNKVLGWILVGIGILGFFIGILINIRMIFMPINLLSAIALFGFTTVGIVVAIKGAVGKRR